MKDSIELRSDAELRDFLGNMDENIGLLEAHLGIEIFARGRNVCLKGTKKAIADGKVVVQAILDEHRETGMSIREIISNTIKPKVEAQSPAAKSSLPRPEAMGVVKISAKKLPQPKSKNQVKYLEAIHHHDIVFGIGPAGTGKTYLAVGMAIEHLQKAKVSRIILTRPAVETGEKLGFLPGDLNAKINPYLRPLLDGLAEMLDPEQLNDLIERGQIEIVPLAYMRGRTLNDSFIIMDEAQNSTPLQMKMFLTRLGFGSKMVITGDVTQVDIPDAKKSGLVESEHLLKRLSGISFVYFKEIDVVRHGLVKAIIRAYEKKK